MVELLYPSSSSPSPSTASSAIPSSFFAPDSYTYTSAETTTAAVASSSRPDPCPFCQFSAENAYSLLLHIETSHIEDSPFVPDDNARATPTPATLIDTDDEDSEYVLCPESDCEEFIPLLQLQTHMDFHDAANLGMEQARGGDRSHRHHRRHDGERGERKRVGNEEGTRHRHRDDGEHREHRKRREEGSAKEKNPKVSFLPASSRSRSHVRSLSWFERVALAIAQPHHVVVVPDEKRSSSRRRSQSRGARSDSRKRSDSAHRRSDSKRRSDSVSLQRPDGKRVEIRKGKRTLSKSGKTGNGIKKLGVRAATSILVFTK